MTLNTGDAHAGAARLAPLLDALLAAIAGVTVFDGLQGVGSMALRATPRNAAPNATRGTGACNFRSTRRRSRAARRARPRHAASA